MLTSEHKLFINRVTKALKWRMDVAGGEMIDQSKDGLQYCKTHLSGPGRISQKDLDLICNIVNNVFDKCGSNLRVANHMGEFLPGMKAAKTIGG